MFSEKGGVSKALWEVEQGSRSCSGFNFKVIAAASQALSLQNFVSQAPLYLPAGRGGLSSRIRNWITPSIFTLKMPVQVTASLDSSGSRGISLSPGALCIFQALSRHPVSLLMTPINGIKCCCLLGFRWPVSVLTPCVGSLSEAAMGTLRQEDF